MRTRLVFVSVLFGYITSQILYIVFRQIWPGYVASRFAIDDINPALAWMGYGLASILILSCGYFTVRLEWARTKGEALRLGATSGFLAACVIYLFSGASAAAGIIGQKDILLSTLRIIASEEEGLLLLANGVIDTALLSGGMFWGILLVGVLLGSLGGLLSSMESNPGWGKPPAWKGVHMNRMIVYTVGFFTVMAIVVIQATYEILADLTRTTISDLGSYSAVPAGIIDALPLASAQIWVAMCGYFAIWWIFEDWQNPRENLRTKIAMMIFTVLMIAFNFMAQNSALVSAAILAAVILLIWAIRVIQLPKPFEEPQTLQKFSFGDIIAAGLSIGASLSALLMGSLIAYTISLVMIAVSNIPHLTLNGSPEMTVASQIKALYAVLQSIAQWMFIGLGIGGFFLAIIASKTGLLNHFTQPPKISADSFIPD